MQLRPAIQIQSVIKALKEVVIPAVDPKNKLALEQVQLSIGLLALMAQRLPQQFRFDCDELERLLAFADTLGAHAGGEPAAELKAARAAGADVRARAQADPEDLVAAVHRLRAATGLAVQAAYEGGDAATQAEVKAKVLAMSQEQLLRERSWVLMQGWEVDPKAVPDIETLLAAKPGATP
ncbi:MAG: hypothetical protein NVS9B10_08320 [Nevskia sp.]